MFLEHGTDTLEIKLLFPSIVGNIKDNKVLFLFTYKINQNYLLLCFYLNLITIYLGDFAS